MLSDDEIDERIARTLADADVNIGLLAAAMQSVADKATETFTQLGESMARLVDASLDAMPREQREMTMALVRCGTPVLDAAVEVEDLTAPPES